MHSALPSLLSDRCLSYQIAASPIRSLLAACLQLSEPWRL